MVQSVSSEQFSWNQDRLGFASGFCNVPIESQTFLERKGLNRRRRKSASLYARGKSAKNFGGFLKTELERIHPKQPRLIVVEIHEIEAHPGLGARTDSHLPSTPRQGGKALFKHYTADHIEHDVCSTLVG